MALGHICPCFYMSGGGNTKISVVFILAFICQGKFMGFSLIDAEDFIFIIDFFKENILLSQ